MMQNLYGMPTTGPSGLKKQTKILTQSHRFEKAKTQDGRRIDGQGVQKAARTKSVPVSFAIWKGKQNKP